MKIPTSHPSIFVSQHETALDDEFPAAVNQALARINSQPSGQGLLASLTTLARNGKEVLVVNSGQSRTAPILTDAQSARRRVALDDLVARNADGVKLARKPLLGKNEGTSARVGWNPDQSLAVDVRGNPSLQDGDASGAFVVLAHELVHARRILKGVYLGDKGDRYDIRSRAGKEEARAVGIGASRNADPSENSIRREHGLPLRLAYGQQIATPLNPAFLASPPPPVENGANQGTSSTNPTGMGPPVPPRKSRPADWKAQYDAGGPSSTHPPGQPPTLPPRKQRPEKWVDKFGEGT